MYHLLALLAPYSSIAKQCLVVVCLNGRQPTKGISHQTMPIECDGNQEVGFSCALGRTLFSRAKKSSTGQLELNGSRPQNSAEVTMFRGLWRRHLDVSQQSNVHVVDLTHKPHCQWWIGSDNVLVGLTISL